MTERLAALPHHTSLAVYPDPAGVAIVLYAATPHCALGVVLPPGQPGYEAALSLLAALRTT